MRHYLTIIGYILFSTAIMADTVNQNNAATSQQPTHNNPSKLVESPTVLLTAQDYFQLYEKKIAEHKQQEALEAISKYARVLQLNPNDQQALHQLALAESWQPKKMDQAAKDFQYYLRVYPNDREAWIQYAYLESWRQNSQAAFLALENYHRRFGTTKEYLAAKARILSSLGYYQSALAINEPLLAKDPKNVDLLYTQAHALNQAHQEKTALVMLNKAQQIDPKSTDVADLKKAIDDSLRPYIEIGASPFRGSDSVRILQVPFYASIPVNYATSVLLKTLYEHLRADIGSGLETIEGQSAISTEKALVGLEHQWNDWLNVKVLGGALHTQNEGNQGVYNIVLETALSEKLKITLDQTHDSYKPYLFSTSPRTVSLRILEDDSKLFLSWEPFWQRYIFALANYGSLSDGNSYWRFNLSPTAKIFCNQYLDLSLGLSADILHFAEQLNNGYYDPNFHQQYVVTTYLGITQNDSIGYYLYGNAGPHRDQTTDGFRAAFIAAGGINWTITPRFVFSVGAEYDYTGSGDTPYHSTLLNSQFSAKL